LSCRFDSESTQSRKADIVREALAAAGLRDGDGQYDDNSSKYAFQLFGIY